MIRSRSVLIAPVFMALAVLPACGGDSGPSARDQAFCKEIEQLDQLDIETDIGAAADILNDLATKAPSDEVRDALNLIAPIFEQLATADQNDAEVMGEIFAMMSSPEIAAASEVLDRYGSEVCGFEDTEDTNPAESTP